MTADLETPPIPVINSYNSLEELVVEFEWSVSGVVWCVRVSEGFEIHNCLRLRVEVAWNGTSCVCV